EAVAAGVPVGRIAGVSLVVEDGDGYGLGVGRGSGEFAPASACPPDLLADLAFAGSVDAGGAGRIGCCDLGGLAVGIEENSALLGWGLEEVSDAHAEQAFLVVVEGDGREGFEGDGHVDGARRLTGDGGAREDVAR